MTVNVYTYYSNRIALGEVSARYAAPEAPVAQKRHAELVPVGVVLGLAMAAGVSIATMCVHPGHVCLQLLSGAGVGAGAAHLGQWLRFRRFRRG